VNTRTVKLIDPSANVLAVAEVVEESDHFEGTIDLGIMPSRERALFKEFEEIVNGQMLSFLDQIQEKIGSLSLRAVFADGVVVNVKDLQIYPSTGDVSFKRGEVLEGKATGGAATTAGGRQN
jgi:hypothetical protein